MKTLQFNLTSMYLWTVCVPETPTVHTPSSFDFSTVSKHRLVEKEAESIRCREKRPRRKWGWSHPRLSSLPPPGSWLRSNRSLAWRSRPEPRAFPWARYCPANDVQVPAGGHVLVPREHEPQNQRFWTLLLESHKGSDLFLRLMPSSINVGCRAENHLKRSGPGPRSARCTGTARTAAEARWPTQQCRGGRGMAEQEAELGFTAGTQGGLGKRLQKQTAGLGERPSWPSAIPRPFYAKWSPARNRFRLNFA